MQLRWYQNEARQSIWDYFYSGKTGNPIVALPTGTGKSVVIGDFVRSVMQAGPRERIIKLTHVKELIEQNFAKLLQLWPLAPAGIYSAGLGRRECSHPVTYAGIGSVAKKAALFGWIDLVIIDECHLLGPKDTTLYQTFLADLKRVNPDVKVIGFTATPYRLGQGSLIEGGLFTDICYDLTTFDGFNRLIEEGFLCPLVPKRPSLILDVSNVGTVAGEYNQHELQAAVDKDEITRKAIGELIATGESRAHWLVFAAGVEHAIHIAEVLNECGIKSIAIHSKMGDDARDQAIAGWKVGVYRCAVNNNILTTGIDFPALDLIGFMAPTKSAVKWVQGLGRGTRPHPGKENCLVLDFAGNTRRLGPINDPIIPRPRGAKGKGEAPVKLCPACDTWNHSSVRFCTSCGQEFIQQVKITEKASDLELIATEKAKDAVKVQTFPVTGIVFDKHIPRGGGPPSLRVTYSAGIRSFSKWVALEHDYGLVKHKARDWWREQAGDMETEPPDTVDEAIERQQGGELRDPTHIQVWLKRPYAEVMAYCYDGTAFGENPA